MRKTTTDKPAVPAFPENAPFWAAAAEGRLLIKHCEDCGQHHFYPRTLCPFCMSERTRWVQASGRGQLYSHTVARTARPVIAPVVVELEEGPRLSSTVFDADLYGLQIGQPVEVRFKPATNGQLELAFTTTAAQQARDYAARATAGTRHVPGLPTDAVEPVRQAALVGAGTMGIGIAMAFANAGIPVLLLDREPAALERAQTRIADQYRQSVEKKRLGAAEAQERMARITTSTDMAGIATADVVIEAVYEQMALKREVFALIDQHARPCALLGSNTSTLDINEIARATRLPGAVIGLHFFSPANVMKLLEVVRGTATSTQTVVRAMALGQHLGKVAVLAEVCPGFIGNRMFGRREREADRLLIEGAMPRQIDRVLTEFGMPMGSCTLADLTSGMELRWHRRQETGEKDWLGDKLVELGRVGQKAGKGYYRYAPGSREPLHDPEVDALIEEASRVAGITRRTIPDNEIRDRLILLMVNEGALLVEEKIALRAGDVDAVWVHGYGWPAWRGGPMYYADTVGLAQICERLLALQRVHGPRFQPCASLVRMAAAGQRFQDA